MRISNHKVDFLFQNFYLRIRRALLHPSCNARSDWHNPKTVDEWKQHPSRKLDVLVELLQYHLNADGQPAMTVSDDALVPGDSINSQPEGLPCDKIVVFSAFPSSNVQLLQVSLGFIPLFILH